MTSCASRARRAPRRTTGLLAASVALALGAPGLVALTATPARADDGCLTEQSGSGGVVCDDSNPPVTDLPTISPTPTIYGYTRATTLTFTMHAHYTDGDVDPITYQYQYWNADAGQPAPDPDTGTWKTASGTTFVVKDLTDSGDGGYHFRVRAVDGGDSSLLRIPTDGNPFTPNPLAPFSPDPDVTDLDTTFDAASQEVVVKVDTAVPNTFLTDVPVDALRPDEPAVTTQDVPLTLDFFDNTKQVAGFYCTLNGTRSPCQPGTFRLKGLAPGKQVFTALTIDRAGNIDPVPASTTFWVPRNLTLAMGGRTTGKSCSRKVDPKFFAGDVIECRRAGDQLHFLSPTTHTREIRLLAPSGPKLGVVEVSVGEGRWIPVDLYSPTQRAVRTYLVRDENQPPKGGQVRVRVKTVSKQRPYVRIDAVLAR